MLVHQTAEAPGPNKEEKMKNIIIIIILLLSLSLFAQYNPKTVGIYILPPGGVPADGTIAFTATIDGTSNSVTHAAYGCGYKALATKGICYVNMASFGYEWSLGDKIIWVISTTSRDEELGNVNQILATGDGTSQYDTDIHGGAFLPVTLSSFTAVYQAGTPVLQWVTQSEVNNSGWNVYRSITESMETSLQINPELIPGGGTTTDPRNYIFTDETEVETGNTYFYMLESVDFSGMVESYGPISIMITIDDGGQSPDIPIIYGLHSNYPNPFNPDTNISFTPEQEGNVSVSILNIKGQKIRTLFEGTIGTQDVGINQSYIWDGKNNQGKLVSSGVYFYQLYSPLRKQTKKMLLVK